MPAKKTVIFITLVLVSGLAGMFLTSCGAASYLDSNRASKDYMGPEVDPAEDYYFDSDEAAEERGDMVSGRVGESALRHVIRSGSLDLTVSDTREAMDEVNSIVGGAGGIVSNSNVYEVREGQYAAYLTLRVPDKNFDPVMLQLEALGKATNMQTGLDDVTMQYIDLESRLNNQKAQEARLVEILELADTVEEILEVERELFRIRGEVETMTAQFDYLKDQVSFSTIHLSLREEAIPTEIISPYAFHNLGSRIVQTFIASINIILNSVSYIIIAFSALLPIVIVLGLLAVLVWLIVRKLSKRRAKVETDIETK